MAVEEIQLTATETANKVKLELVPIINAKETENIIVWSAFGLIGIGTFIYGLIKADNLLAITGGSMMGLTLLRFSIKLGFNR
jgi:hypothetical protein